VIRVFIGYDSAEEVAFSVLAHSIHARASTPVAAAPVMLSQLKEVFRRPHNALQSTQFSFSRFLTPWLAGYEGWALFMDCDMLMLEDIAELWKLRDERYAVQVVKHVHVPKEDVKFLGHTQTKYEKKNWSSVMLMNCARCRALTPEYVNTASGLELHQFKWLGTDALIGELPSRWNHLVGYDRPRRDAAVAHFTIGGPWFEPYRDCEFADEWRREREAMLSSQGRAGA
jgi:lipopolysaccharide biosynthesis glycosyltransferase